ncbi:hypothetical protein DL546_002587 [Coniochaeta pulveracea]|uniref:Uncharacterized protein n=1 Tax=Coniochaeta pulveracea TaxID=177199 RepID=A0A420YD08_9PEZI|nr:hypothetical protein DL546_002587 [Coniochaeta pulveracea]
MPIPLVKHIYDEGLPSWFPDPYLLLKAGSALGAVAMTKRYTSGAINTSERKMHGRVVLITGGTSGIGAEAAYELALRGAQIVLLTRLPPSDPWLIEYIDDLREKTNNELIYAEQVDLSDLHNIRQFATKWIDNAPPRRLDMIILCANIMTPPGGKRLETEGGVESMWQVNFLANFHLLGILSPAIRAQPFDRDVRIIIPTCSSYIASPPLSQPLSKKDWTPRKAYARSKLAMMVFGQAFQKHLDAYKRPDGLPSTPRVIFVDPGFTRTPGMRLAWLSLKSPAMGAQSLLFAALEGSLVRGSGGKFIKECHEVDFARKDVTDEEIAKQLWEASDKLIENTEKELGLVRALKKKAEEENAKAAKEAQKVEEIDALVQAIKKGKEKEKIKGKAKDQEKDSRKTKSRKKGNAHDKAAT